MMKMSRDRLKAFTTQSPFVSLPESSEEEETERRICAEIVAASATGLQGSDSQWEKMYELAAIIMKNTLKKYMA